MATTNTPGTRNSRKPVDLFGAVDEGAEIIAKTPYMGPMLRNVLKHAASRAIFCPVTRNVLDLRTIVLITVEGTDTLDTVIGVDPEAWMASGKGTVDLVHAQGGTVKVLTRKHVDTAVRAANKAAA